MAEQHNGHLTTEQLSSSLDKQLSPQEQAVFDAHLHTCPSCQQRLADLGRTVALLHALPQAELPRSFVLPTRAAPIPIRSNSQVQPANSNRVRLYALRRSFQALSSIAALLGIIFLLSGFFGGLPHGGVPSSAPTAGAPAANPSIHNTYTPPIGHANTPASRSSQPGVSTPTHIQTPQPTSTIAPARAHTGSAGQPLLPALDISKPGGQETLGGILLVIGVLGLIFVRRRREERA